MLQTCYEGVKYIKTTPRNRVVHSQKLAKILLLRSRHVNITSEKYEIFFKSDYICTQNIKIQRMNIGIITAMSSEYAYIESLLSDKKSESGRLFSYTHGEIAGNRVVLLQSGIGKVNSAVGAAEMISLFAPDCVVSSGVAGGIDASLCVMDLVVSSRCCYHDVWCGEGNERGQVQGLPLYFEGSETLRHYAMQITSANGSEIHEGLIVSGDQFITNREELNQIKQAHPEALAVDMESCSIAQCCYLYKTPFVSFRVISDTPGATDDHAAQYENFWGEIASRSFTTIERLLRSLPTTL